MDYVVAQSISQDEKYWFLYFLRHDPAVDISVVSCRVLALYGSLDIQVPPERNLESMQMALSENPLALVMEIDGANHLFQASVDGTIEEYATLEPEFTDGFESTVSDWILDVTR